jgi:hypothetical protein
MEIGKLYELKRLYWFLYQTREDMQDLYISCELSSSDAKRTCQEFDIYNTKISFLDPDSLVLCIEKDPSTDVTDFYKVLTSNGEIGWIMVHEWGRIYCH